MKCDKKNMLLYAITDRAWTSEENDLYSQVEEALKGGVTCIQLREKNMGFDEFLNEAIKIGGLCRSYNVPFIINDNIDIAIKSDADGVHIGQGDMDLVEARKYAGDDMIIGVSARTVEQAVVAEKNGANYLGVGAVFTTSTKLDASNISMEALKQICNSVSIPVVAIGGISKDNILQLNDSGIAGVAVVSAIFSKSDIEGETKELYSLAEKTVGY